MVGNLRSNHRYLFYLAAVLIIAGGIRVVLAREPSSASFAVVATDNCTPTPIVYSDVLNGTITPAGETACYSFVGEAGDSIHVSLTGTSGALVPALAVLRPDATALCSAQAVPTLNCVLDAAGSHTILVQDSDTTSTGTFDISLTRLPEAANDAAETAEDKTVMILALGNDSDPDGDALIVESLTQPTNGTVIINSNGMITYTPALDFNGIDSFTYMVSDDHGGTDTATATVTVTAENDSPVGMDDAAVTDEDMPAAINILANDMDVDGDSLKIANVFPPKNGLVSFDPNGTATYTPFPNFNGTDSFEYVILDGQNGDTGSATVTIAVNPLNDRPEAANDEASTLPGTPVVIDVLKNDFDVDGNTLAMQNVTPPANGSVALNADGTITYAPNPGFSGTDVFAYTVSDGLGGVTSTTITVYVGEANIAPLAVDEEATTTEDTLVAIRVLDNDTDPDGDALMVSAVALAANGSVTHNGTSVFYLPYPGFYGTDRFTYTARDGHGGTALGMVTITVNPINQKPVAFDDHASTDEDRDITISVSSNDIDPDGDPLIVVSVGSASHGTVIKNADGTIHYTPHSDYNGVDSFVYGIGDGHGSTVNATVALAIGAVNDAPHAVDDTAATHEQIPVTIGVLANDSDVDSTSLEVQEVSDPLHGTVTVDGTNVTYTPAAGFGGTDSFTYAVSDGQGGTATASVSVVVDSSPIQAVGMDVSLNSSTNTINLNSLSRLKVAIFSSPTFDAQLVRADTLSLEQASVVPERSGWPLFSLADVNSDGLKDMIVYVNIQDMDLGAADTEAVLRGQTAAGLPFMSTDQIIVIPRQGIMLFDPWNGTTVHRHRPTLRWIPVAFNTCYQIQLNDAPFTSDEQAALQEVTSVSLPSYRVTYLPDGTYYWRVRVGGTCHLKPGPWSEAWSFTIEDW